MRCAEPSSKQMFTAIAEVLGQQQEANRVP